MDTAQTARSVALAATTENRILKWWRKRGPRIVYLIRRAPRNLWWEIMYRVHPKHRYNVVLTGLPPGYYEIDTLMLESWMRLMRRYVEDERHGVTSLQEHIDWLEQERSEMLAADQDWRAPAQESIDLEKEALAIYRWWTEERAPAWAAYEGRFDDGYFSRPREERQDMALKNHEAQEALHAKDEEMLGRMLKIRRCLWT